MTAAIGLVAIMERRVMAGFCLADRGSPVKCPFGHVGFQVPLAKRVRETGPVPLGLTINLTKGLLTMSFFLIVLIGGFVLAAATALIRGLRAFFLDAEMIRQNENVPREAIGVQQNRMMTQRVLFQGIAILLVTLLGALASQN